MKRFHLGLRAARALGFSAVAPYASYQLRMKSGLLRRQTPIHAYEEEPPCGAYRALPAPDWGALSPYLEANRGAILAEGESLLEGYYRPFMGEEEMGIVMIPYYVAAHWSDSAYTDGDDIKLAWEPTRFSWAWTLARAWALTRDERYSDFFWKQVHEFMKWNPPNRGENWNSAQEVAIRLINLTLCARCFLSPEPKDEKEERKQRENREALTLLTSAHARRIPPTLDYARAQRNNHWLSEALGLMVAACVLPDAPESAAWLNLGWKEFTRGLNAQIIRDGCYLQFSANYHRMALQLILAADMIRAMNGLEWTEILLEKIPRSIRWLAAHVDPMSGGACNLGHNDGTYLFPASGGYADYRPTLQAASRRFLDASLFEPGAWDELALWFPTSDMAKASAKAFSGKSAAEPAAKDTYMDQTVLRLEHGGSWALLRAAGYPFRPAHDDQLHVDLWHNGENLAMDAGTYRYNAAAPWNNGLKSAFTHNTLTVDWLEPMTDAGKFLWLDWDQARILTRTAEEVSAERFGLNRFGLRQMRSLSRCEDGFLVTDRVEKLPAAPVDANRDSHHFRLHWLLKVGSFAAKPVDVYRAKRLENDAFEMQSKGVGWSFRMDHLTLQISVAGSENGCLKAIIAGKEVFNSREREREEEPTSGMDGESEESMRNPADEKARKVCGWVSKTYDEKKAALSLVFEIDAPLPFEITTRFTLGGKLISG